MKILARDVQDLQDHNYTRFLLVEKGLVPKGDELTEGIAKTSLAFCIKNEPGSLFRTLAAFGSRENVDVVRIESRNLKGTESRWTKFVMKDWTWFITWILRLLRKKREP